jgi:hypothetical protein
VQAMPIKTLQDRQEAAVHMRSLMKDDHKTAVEAYEKRREFGKPPELPEIRELHRIKHRIASKASHLGFPKACRESIPVCGGECCRWHFPKKLSVVDFFISLHYLSQTQRNQLDQKLGTDENIRYQCPLLNSDGCIFHFDARPLVCTVAYPCFTRQSYWEYYAKWQKDLLAARQGLSDIIKGLIL